MPGVKVLAAERRQAIANLIRQRSSVRVEDLCARFGTSASTIRRDLEYLERRGTLKRMYGGAMVADGEALASDRESTPPSLAKSRIGAAAAALIAEGETVFLGPGTTTLAVARHLAPRSNVTVVTNALSVATYLTDRSQLSVIVTGGQVERPQTALLGHLAELTLGELRADRAIIGVGGIHVPDGLTGDSLPGVQFVRSVIELMPELVIVADSSKWGRIGPAFLAALEAIDVIVTDLDAPPAMVWDLTQLGIQIIQT
jgi:DeoR/GlpR family transcriptional regulator of sugar metabolism